jgi:hypothetical protein
MATAVFVTGSSPCATVRRNTWWRHFAAKRVLQEHGMAQVLYLDLIFFGI